MTEYMRRRAAQALSAVQSGRLARQHDAARFFVEGCLRGRIDPAGTEQSQLEALASYLEHDVVKNAEFAVWADHRRTLLSDAGIIRGNVAPPVGALILYATWIEHWANGLLKFFGPRSGLSQGAIRKHVASSPKNKLVTVPQVLRIPPLPSELRDPLGELLECRNKLLHFEWHVTMATLENPMESRVHHLVDEAARLIPEVHRHTLTHLYEPALSVAEHLFAVDREDLVLSIF